MLFREDLNEVKCDCPDCQDDITSGHEFYIHSKCHLHAGLEVSYRGDGTLVLRCNECQTLVTEVAVASRNSEPNPNERRN